MFESSKSRMLMTLIFGYMLCMSEAKGAESKSSMNDEAPRTKRSTFNDLVVEGPKTLWDSIAIVGAGVSGIHMATMLKEKGFKNIKIYEKSKRIGGKSETVHFEGIAQELGSCCIGPGYENNVIALIEKYVPGDLLPRKMQSVWLDNKEEPISYGNYVVMKTMEHFQTNDPLVAIGMLVGKINSYVSLHKKLFGEYEFELMPIPPQSVLDQLRCSYLEFLKRHKLESLVPLLIVTHTVQGYGYLDEIGAFYGLMWNSPVLLEGLKSIITGDPKPRTFLVKQGFQNLWETIAKKENLNIKFGSEISAVHRYFDEDGNTNNDKVKICDRGGCYEHDFVIWSPELKSSLYHFKPYYKKEEEYFSKMKSVFLVATLVSMSGGKEASTATSYWLDNLSNKRDYSVYASRNKLKALQSAGMLSSVSSSYNQSTYGALLSEVAYQYSARRPCNTRRKVSRHFYTNGATSVTLRKHKVWKYFPHFSTDDAADGILWNILGLQGKYKMWYIGSSVSFESLKSVLEYNKLLLSLAKLPTS